MSLSEVNPPGFGVMVDDVEAIVTARGNLSAGYCYPFCDGQSALITSAGVTISTSPGDVGYIYGNVAGGVGAVTADLFAGRFCIALKDCLDGRTTNVKVKGFVRAFVANSTSSGTAVSIGSELVVLTSGGVSSYLDAKLANVSTSPRKYVAKSLTAISAAVASAGATLVLVDFDGWDGIGSGGNV